MHDSFDGVWRRFDCLLLWRRFKTFNEWVRFGARKADLAAEAERLQTDATPALRPSPCSGPQRAESGHRLPMGVRLFATQTGYDRLGLFNYLVGAGEDQRPDSEAERPGGLEVADEFECGRLLNRKISRLSSLQGAVDIASGAAKDLEDAGAVGDEQAPRRTRGRR